MALVNLTSEEIAWANEVGKRRYEESRADGRNNAHGLAVERDMGIPFDQRTSRAELAAAKAMGEVWPAHVNNFKGPDIGDNIQVRSIDNSGYRLIVRPGDKETDIFILVHTINEVEYDVLGWIKGKDAKRFRYRRSPRGRPSAYFVPQKDLQDFPVDLTA